MRLRFDREARRRWKDVTMNFAALLCVVIALVPLGSLLFEATIRGIRSITPSFLTLTTGNGRIGNAIRGTLVLIALTSVIALPVGSLSGLYLAHNGNNGAVASARVVVAVRRQLQP